MVNVHIIVNMLVLVRHEQAIGFIIAALCVQQNIGIVPYQSAMQSDRIGPDSTVGFLVDEQVGK